VIEFGFVCICCFPNFDLLLREKLPRFGASRSPTAVIIPVCFLAHRFLLEVLRSISGFSGNVKGLDAKNFLGAGSSVLPDGKRCAYTRRLRELRAPLDPLGLMIERTA
jgi:hypothetical protein